MTFHKEDVHVVGEQGIGRFQIWLFAEAVHLAKVLKLLQVPGILKPGLRADTSHLEKRHGWKWHASQLLPDLWLSSSEWTSKPGVGTALAWKQACSVFEKPPSSSR